MSNILLRCHPADADDTYHIRCCDLQCKQCKADPKGLEGWTCMVTGEHTDVTTPCFPWMDLMQMYLSFRLRLLEADSILHMKKILKDWNLKTPAQERQWIRQVLMGEFEVEI